MAVYKPHTAFEKNSKATHLPNLLEREKRGREMGSYSISKLAMATVVVLLGMASLVGPSAGQTTPACAQNLVPCADYLKNTAQPAANCCTAIKQAVATQFACLCNLFFTPGLLEAFGGNATSGLRIATACGESMDTAKCKGTIAQFAICLIWIFSTRPFQILN